MMINHNDLIPVIYLWSYYRVEVVPDNYIAADSSAEGLVCQYYRFEIELAKHIIASVQQDLEDIRQYFKARDKYK